MIGEFNPTYSTNNIWVDEEFDYCLTLLLESIQASITSKADASHTHDDYASQSALTLLENMIASKANVNHTHTEYAPVNHDHDNYALATALNALSDEVGGKAAANHAHSYNDLTDKPTIPSTEGLATTTYVDDAVASIPSVTLADLGFQSGKVVVSCTANTVSTANVTFDRVYTTAPIVTLTAGSSAPGTAVQEVTVSNVTTTGFTINVYRTNTSATSINWMAAGQV